MTLAPGRRIGPYEIIAAIGAGGMGEVYRAVDTNLKRQVAIKVLPESLSTDPDRLARFQREAEILASLNHPNIAHVHGLEKFDGALALVLELVEGPTLADRISKGRISFDEAVPVATQIAEALEVAHEQGVIHRDLKPANIKVRDDGTVKVLDFGLAKLVEPAPPIPEVTPSVTASPTITTPAMMTGVGMLLGTAAYMSPEQAKGRPADKRSDIWAFGCVLFEMLTGRQSFTGTDVSETLAAVLKDEPDWNALPAATPRGMHTLLRRCLQRDPERRLRDISDARFQIEDTLNEPRAAGTIRPGRSVARRLIPAAGVTAVVLAAVAATWYARPAPPPGDELRLEIGTPPTTTPASMAISPDGRTVVFATMSSASELLWLRSLNDSTAKALPGTERAEQPFWSPDGASIGFFADGQLKRIDVKSGAVQTLADAWSPFGGAWNRDDTILYTPFPASPVLRIPASGGSATAVSTVDAETQNDRFPQILPDGRHFLYYATGTAPGIYVAELGGPQRARLLEADAAVFAAPGHLLFVRQGVLYAQAFDPEHLKLSGRPTTVEQQVVAPSGVGSSALSASTDGRIVYRAGKLESTRHLVWFDRSGKELERVPGSNWASGVNVALSPDGRTVAFDQLIGGTTDIWLFDLARKVSTRFTSNPSFELFPIWSPDGKRIAFQSSRKNASTGTTFDAYVKSLDGEGREELAAKGEGNQIPSDWSPDGRFLLYTDSSAVLAGLFAVDLEGDRKPFPVVDAAGANNGEFSPDGKWIAYQSLEPGRRPEIFVQRFPGPKTRVQISVGGGVQVRWRRDGRELFYLAPDSRLMAVPIRLDAGHNTVEAGTPLPLFAARLSGSPQGPVNRQYMVSMDGQRFLLDAPAEVMLPITVLLNWRANP
jgi:eukaryotic-like serine/threonine-protein kinase